MMTKKDFTERLLKAQEKRKEKQIKEEKKLQKSLDSYEICAKLHIKSVKRSYTHNRYVG